jgi:SsrA-binding protein
MAAKKMKAAGHEPVIENRRARHDFFIEDTLECGIKLTGTEVKSLREGRVSLGEGYVRADDGLDGSLVLVGVHIGEYPPAGAGRQHVPTRSRVLLAHRREIRRLADHTLAKGQTLLPLKLYFVRGRAKLLVGLARGKQQHDKRQDLAKRQAQREISRAMSRKR